MVTSSLGGGCQRVGVLNITAAKLMEGIRVEDIKTGYPSPVNK
jgi:hypothetical protein